MGRFNTLQQCRLLLTFASWIVPRRLREEWLKEWEAELAHGWEFSLKSGSLLSSNLLRWRCCGSFIDAAWCRCNLDEIRYTGNLWPQTPTFVLMALLCTLLLFAVASGDLLRMRSILLKPPYDDPQRIATVSRTGVINSSEWVVPYSWVEIWRKQEQSAVSVAAYSWRLGNSVVIVDGKPAKVASVQVEDNLFQVFGVKPVMGRTVHLSDRDVPELLLSYETWRKDFSRDPAILQKKVFVDGREARVVGVLPARFWFPSNEVGMWRLADKAAFTGDNVGVVARLSPQISDRRAHFLLQRDISNMTGETFSEASLQVWPVQDRIRQPLIFYSLALGVVLVLMFPVIWSGRWNLRPRGAKLAVACRWWSFFSTKSFLLLSILLALVIEFTPEPYVFPAGKTTFVVESASLWIFSIGSVFALWWSIADQQGRCRVCLRKLALPAHIGRSGCLLLSWVGTELACREGHGLLHVTETDVCWLEPAQWTPLDESWESLFSPEPETEAFG